MPQSPVLVRLAALALAVLLVAPVAFAEDDDGPVSVPFEDMTDEEWDRIQERKVNFHVAWAQWATYDAMTCVFQANHEARLEAWRVAVQAWNADPSKPDPGERPSVQGLPDRPTLPRPGAMPPFQGCGI